MPKYVIERDIPTPPPGGFPANHISAVRSVIGPTTAEG